MKIYPAVLGKKTLTQYIVVNDWPGRYAIRTKTLTHQLRWDLYYTSHRNTRHVVTILFNAKWQVKIIPFTSSNSFFSNFVTETLHKYNSFKKLTFPPPSPPVFRHILIWIITLYKVFKVAILFALRWFPANHRDRLVLLYYVHVVFYVTI